MSTYYSSADFHTHYYYTKLGAEIERWVPRARETPGAVRGRVRLRPR